MGGRRILNHWKWLAILCLVDILSLSWKCARSEEMINQEILADAIYVAEGGKKAVVPYGILSLKVASEAEARRICLNTINNTLARWQYAKQEGDKRDFITFLGNRYAPTKNATNDPLGLNSNWVRNVKRIYAQELDKGEQDGK